MENVTEEQFKQLLEEHDWYYGFSDDQRIWERGERTLRRIKQLMKDNPKFEQLYIEKGNEMFKTY